MKHDGSERPTSLSSCLSPLISLSSASSLLPPPAPGLSRELGVLPAAATVTEETETAVATAAEVVVKMVVENAGAANTEGFKMFDC